MWSNFYEEGGWGMYPTSVFGFLLLGVAMLIALRPERRFFPAALCLAGMTLGSGALGCSMGLVNTFAYIHKVQPVEQLAIIAAGSSESLNNVVLALIVFVLSALVAGVGAARVALNGGPSKSA